MHNKGHNFRKTIINTKSKAMKRSSSSKTAEAIAEYSHYLNKLRMLLFIYYLLSTAFRLQNEAKHFMKEIEEKRSIIAHLDKKIVVYQEQILDQKTRLGGVNAAQVNNSLIQKQIRVLDSRLDKSLTKFNETVAHNKELRQKIDQYRRERIIFDGIYKKLEWELYEKKKEIAAIIDDSKNAYQARDKSQSEMIALQQQAEKERTDFELEFKEINELMKQQQAELENLRLRQFERTNEEPAVAALTNEERAGENVHSAGIKEKSAISQEKIHYYEDILLKIQEASGIYNINDVIAKFIDAEEQNFSLFNYVNDVNSEIDQLEHVNSSMRSEIERHHGLGQSDNTKRKKNIRDLEEKLVVTDKKVQDLQAKYEVSVRIIQQLRNGIQNIFTRIGATASSSDDIMGNQGVTETNMMHYLGIIEQKTTEILQTYAASQVGVGQNMDTPLMLPVVVHGDAAGGKINFAPPSYDDMSSGEDSEGEKDERPLTRNELARRTMKFTIPSPTGIPSPSYD
jgi:hypothetical protein